MMRYAAWYKPGKNFDENNISEVLSGHRAHLRGLFEQGQLIFSGPLLDGSHDGLAIFDAESEEAARDWVNSDPAVRGEILVPSLHPYKTVFDRITNEAPEN